MAYTRRTQLAQGLGWFSIGLGLLQVTMPRRVSRLIGAPHAAAVMPLLGAREIVSGAGLLADRRRPAMWLNARLGGDMMDLALLALALRAPRGRSRKLAATALVAGVTGMDAYTRRAFGRSGTRTLRLRTVVQRAPEELYQFWRELGNLPRVMANLRTVERIGDRRWHWVAEGPLGPIEWDADVTAEHPPNLVTWRSVEGEPIQTAGAVRFERLPGDRGTVVKVDMHYHAPGAAMAALLGRLLGRAPEQQLREAMRTFKQIMESGEAVSPLGQPPPSPAPTPEGVRP